jgi:hypothetical protein
VTELVGWEHSMKNELIIARDMARHVGCDDDQEVGLSEGTKQRAAAERLTAILEEFGLKSLLATRFRLPEALHYAAPTRSRVSSTALPIF